MGVGECDGVTGGVLVTLDVCEIVAPAVCEDDSEGVAGGVGVCDAVKLTDGVEVVEKKVKVGGRQGSAMPDDAQAGTFVSPLPL